MAWSVIEVDDRARPLSFITTIASPMLQVLQYTYHLLVVSSAPQEITLSRRD
jgi:hypothetical protein